MSWGLLIFELRLYFGFGSKPSIWGYFVQTASSLKQDMKTQTRQMDAFDPHPGEVSKTPNRFLKYYH